MTANSNWSIAQYLSDGSARLGILVGDTVYAAPSDWPQTAAELFDQWSEWAEQLQALDITALETVEGATLVAPITYPRKVICAGANYAKHVAEMAGGNVPASAPWFFMKPPSTAIVGPGAEVAMPVGDPKLDWEAELGIVIGKGGTNLTPEDAMRHVAGYVASNDLSARGPFSRADAIAPPFSFDWYAHKAFDGSCPIGPGIVPAWMVEDPESLRISLSVNGVMKQDANTSDFIAGVAELVAAASRNVTLEPGDLILTGTPSGVGMPTGEFLRVGDVVVVEIEGLGRLETTIVDSKGS